MSKIKSDLIVSGTVTADDPTDPTHLATKDYVDNKPSVPVGGTTGQVLAKASNADGDVEWSDGGGTGFPYVVAIGGSVVDIGGYRIHTFDSNGALTITNAPSGATVEYLIVGGGSGGSGGQAGSWYGAGGAGGTVRSGSIAVTAQVYSIEVGVGGTGGPYNSGSSTAGGTSSFAGISATGGLAVVYNSRQGGANADFVGGSGAGIDSGGGAGGAGNGLTPAGGIGFSSNISGTTKTYAVGGDSESGSGNVPVANSGNGGDGTGGGVTGRNGSSGVVIVRYAIDPSSILAEPLLENDVIAYRVFG